MNAPAQELPLFYQPSGNEVTLFSEAAAQGMPVLIKGPTGCGKTRFVQHMAQRLGRPLYTVACHDDLSAADLVGRHLIGSDGTWWQDGPLTRAVREGGICYLDEVVEARQDTVVVLHPLADDRRELFIERTGESLVAPPGFMLVVSYNPGYQNLLKGMKPSTRQRFVALYGRVSLMMTRSPMPAVLFSSCAFTLLVRRMTLPYSGCFTRSSTSTTMVLSILSLTT